MKVTISKRDIVSAARSNGKWSPVEIALMDMDCFEEVRLSRPEPFQFRLDIDGNNVSLPKSVQKGLISFYEHGEMRPMSFDLVVEEDFLMGSGVFEEMDDFYGFGMNY